MGSPTNQDRPPVSATGRLSTSNTGITRRLSRNITVGRLAHRHLVHRRLAPTTGRLLAHTPAHLPNNITSRITSRLQRNITGRLLGRITVRRPGDIRRRSQRPCRRVDAAQEILPSIRPLLR